jgi:hypothetical protein
MSAQMDWEKALYGKSQGALDDPASPVMEGCSLPASWADRRMAIGTQLARFGKQVVVNDRRRRMGIGGWTATCSARPSSERAQTENGRASSTLPSELMT